MLHKFSQIFYPFFPIPPFPSSPGDVDDILRDYFAVLEHVQRGFTLTKTYGILGLNSTTFWTQRPIAEMFIADRWEFENILRDSGDSWLDLSMICKFKLQKSPSREKAELLRSLKKLLPLHR